MTSEDGEVNYDHIDPVDHVMTLPEGAAEGKGLHIVEATLLRDGKPLRTYRSGFWMRDWQYLLSRPLELRFRDKNATSRPSSETALVRLKNMKAVKGPIPLLNEIIAATGFVRLPVGLQLRRSAVSLAP